MAPGAVPAMRPRRATRLQVDTVNGRVVEVNERKDVLKGGPGNDSILAADGQKDSVDCGPGIDKAQVDRKDKVRNCEHVTRG